MPPDEASPDTGASTPNYAETGLTLAQAAALDFDDGLGADTASPDPDEQDEDAEQQDAPEAPEGEEPEGEASEDDGETEDDEGQPEGDEFAELEPEAYEKTRVKLPDGSSQTLRELVDGNLREKDYRVKTARAGETLRLANTQAAQVVGVMNTLIDHLAQHLPDEPDTSLLFSGDPQQQAQYHRQKALHDGALAQLQGLSQLAGQAKQAGEVLTREEFSAKIDAENEKLEYALPELKDPKVRQQFDRRAAALASAIGYSPEELGRATDHRLYVLAHYAAIGVESLQKQSQTKDVVAKKVNGAPPVRPVDRRAAKPSELHSRRNREAIARAKKSGSLKDALAVDFD